MSEEKGEERRVLEDLEGYLTSPKSKLLIFSSPNLGEYERGGEERDSTYIKKIKKFKLSILPLLCQFIYSSLKLTNEGHYI
jgi:hypothetical protein